jgi:hypothetical protein
MQCINGVSSNPVEGRTKICQLTDLFLTLFGLIFRRIYIKVNTLKMFINFIGNIFYARKRNIIVSLYIVNVIYLQINTWAFPYWPGYHPETPILARDAVEGQYGSRDDNQANMEMPCIKLFITYFRHLEKRHPYWSETKSRPILARANMGLDMEMIL